MAIQRVDSRRARELLSEGAVAVEVLPGNDYRTEHLPGARSVPLPELTAEAVADIDRDQPLVVYCYDTQCDLSARAAALLGALGYTAVHDYTGSKAAWLAMGWPAEGDVRDVDRAGGRVRKAATCGPDTSLADLPEPGAGNVVVVVDDTDIVLGTVRPEASAPVETSVLDVLSPGVATVRPSITVDELARSMDADGQDHILVTTLEGMLLGVVLREDLRVDR